MKYKLIDFVSYKNQQIQEINLDVLKNNNLCTLASLIADELLLIDGQLLTLQHTEDNIIKNRLDYLSKSKESLTSVISKINEHVFNKKTFNVNFIQLNVVIKTISFHLESLKLINKEDTQEYKRLCILYQKLKPIYDTNKEITLN